MNFDEKAAELRAKMNLPRIADAILGRSIYYDKEGKPLDLAGWCARFEDVGYQRIAIDELPSGYRVSTVWLGSDHSFGFGGPPLIFETMVFYGDFADRDMDRYSTLEDAQSGHAAMVEKWRNAQPPKEDANERSATAL